MLTTARIVARNSSRMHNLSLSSSSSSLFLRRHVRKLSSSSKFGVGSHFFSQTNHDTAIYDSVIKTALETQKVDMIEAGQEKEIALARAYEKVATEPAPFPVTLMTRIGYRTIEIGNEKENNTNALQQPLPFDMVVEEYTMQKKNESSDSDSIIQVVHNLSPEFLIEAVRESPLRELQTKYPESIRLLYMIHNPEVQTQREEDVDLSQQLANAFDCLQQELQDSSSSAFGITSNGLSLPVDHPLHLSCETIFRAKEICNNCDLFTTIQLPANVMETTGIDVAKRLLQRDSSLKIHAMRPLTCYPDRGTGTLQHPHVLVDYLLPTSSQEALLQQQDENNENNLQFTNNMTGPPAAYRMALNMALSHFDAEELLNAKTKRDLTAQERETLDGCKLLQSLIHDLDVGLEHTTTFAEHEQMLFTKIIPLIRDTFEEYDEDTAHVMQVFFASHSLAVRYHIAKKTRQLLKDGIDVKEHGPPFPSYPDIPDDVTLQEFALESLLQEDVFDKIIVGCSRPEHVMENLELVDKIVRRLEASKKDKNS